MFRIAATIAFIALLAVAWAGSFGYASAQSSTPLNLQPGDSALPTESRAALGADSANEAFAREYFHVDWGVSPVGHGMSRITGYVYNDYGQTAEDVELKITGLDASGQQVNTSIEHINDTVPARGRGYFDFRVPTSQSYEVDVASFDFVMGHGRN